MEILVGATGFVGSNLAREHHFDMLCSSRNIADAFGTNPEILVYSGVPAEMFLANTNPDADRGITENAAENIRRIHPKRLVLISTIAVLDHPAQCDEDGAINESGLSDYGKNRLALERSARNMIPRCHIVRLPALFGPGLKKNFIYDLIHFFPTMLNEKKYCELTEREPVIAENYIINENGFYYLTADGKERFKLKAAFERVGFSALMFTDSRSAFQFYNLAYLWQHIEIVLKNDISLLHLAVEPVSAGKLYEYLYQKPFINELEKPPFAYDYRTKYAGLFGGKNGYIFTKEELLPELKVFVEKQRI